MKHPLIMVTILLLLISPAALAQGNGYDLPWWTSDGGGGSSSGGGYSLSGSIGQVEAGTLIGGGYSLSGGFWFDEGPVSGPGSQRVYLPLIAK